MIGLPDRQFNPDRDVVLARVCAILADQLAITAFEVKPDDDINEDLGAAGVDVEEIFTEISRIFGTDFSELGEYFGYFFYPEVSPAPNQFLIGLVLLLVVVALIYLFRVLPFLIAAFIVTVVALVVVVALRLSAAYRERTREPAKLRFTVNDLVDAVMVGKWMPPEDIWDRVDKLGRKKQWI